MTGKQSVADSGHESINEFGFVAPLGLTVSGNYTGNLCQSLNEIVDQL